MGRGRGETWGIWHRLLMHFLYPAIWIFTVWVLLSWGVLGSFDFRFFVILLVAGLIAGFITIAITYYMVKRARRKRGSSLKNIYIFTQALANGRLERCP